jgi:hypothetical protein
VKFAMQPLLAAQTSSALKITSTIRWHVRPLPAAQAASGDGDRRDRSGILSSMGRMQPWLSGISDATRHRNEYMVAEFVTAGGAFQFPVNDVSTFSEDM